MSALAHRRRHFQPRQAMTDAAKRVLDALAEVVHQKRLANMYGDSEMRMGMRQAAFKRLWVAYDDYEREQPSIDHGYRHG